MKLIEIQYKYIITQRKLKGYKMNKLEKYFS